jgi:hypothetical protein
MTIREAVEAEQVKRICKLAKDTISPTLLYNLIDLFGDV